MGNLGNIAGIKDFQALKAIQELDRRLDSATCQLARLRQNSSTIITELASVTMPEVYSTGAPSHIPNSGSIYTKDVSGITELFFRDSNGSTLGREVQITDNGAIKLPASGPWNTVTRSVAEPTPSSYGDIWIKAGPPDIVYIRCQRTGAIDTWLELKRTS